MTSLIKPIEQKIYIVRGQKVLMDSDLAGVYHVSTKRLNQQVARNRRRFPADFMFQLTVQEAESLKLQNATSNRGRGGRRTMPYVFTEHGAVMVAAVLNTSFAVEASIQIARAFVRLRFILSQHEELSDKLAVLEKKWATHDDQISSLFEAIRALMEIPSTDKKTIGYEVSR